MVLAPHSNATHVTGEENKNNILMNHCLLTTVVSGKIEVVMRSNKLSGNDDECDQVEERSNNYEPPKKQKNPNKIIQN